MKLPIFLAKLLLEIHDMKYLISMAGVIFALGSTGCDDDSSATALPATEATASVLCGISESGS